jgi:hypothetical protein
MNKYLSNLALAASVLAVGYSGLVSAHCKNFNDPIAQLKLGNIGPVNAGNADVFRFRCFNDGVHGNAVNIQYQVLSQVGGDVSAQAVSQGGTSGSIVTDTTSTAGAFFDDANGCAYTGAGSASALATKAVAGNGNQTLIVSRSGTSAATAREYGVLFHCNGSIAFPAGEFETGTAEVHVGSVGPRFSGRSFKFFNF